MYDPVASTSHGHAQRGRHFAHPRRMLLGRGPQGAGKTELKLYNDKGAWSKYFEEMGSLSKQKIGLGMKPVGYTDSADVPGLHQGVVPHQRQARPLQLADRAGVLAEIVKQKQVAETTEVWQEAIKNGDLSQDVAKLLHRGREAVLRADERRLLGDVLQQEGLRPARSEAPHDLGRAHQDRGHAEEEQAARVLPHLRALLLRLVRAAPRGHRPRPVRQASPPGRRSTPIRAWSR